MRRPVKNPARKLSVDSQRLTALAEAIMQAGSRLEERAWEHDLDALLLKLLKGGHQESLDAALDQLFEAESDAAEVLMEAVEAVSASCVTEHDGASHDALLIAVPILAWTRFAIASGPIGADMLATLTAHLYAHVLATGTRLAMAPTLFAIDQLPRTHAETLAMTQRMANAALTGRALPALSEPPETAPFLADTRYLLAVVAAPAGQPLFRWQMAEGRADIVAIRNDALKQWQVQALPNIERLLPGCGIELLLPEAYYAACREADIKIRAVSIRAAVHYLTHALAVEPRGLSAIVGGFGADSVDARIDEYRVSFTLRQQQDVLYGVVWPLYGQEDAGDGLPVAVPDRPYTGLQPQHLVPIDEILALLKECGIVDVQCHEEQFPMEFCDDCGAPLYCDMQAELVHAQMPEDTPHSSGHLH
jgi:hypothetical protein